MNEIDAAERDRETAEREQEHERRLIEQEREIRALQELQRQNKQQGSAVVLKSSEVLGDATKQ